MFLDTVFAARSDIGLLRSTNQDSAYAGSQILVVADGMGGAAGGDIASSLAVAALAALDSEAIGPDEALDALKAAIAKAHTDIVDRARKDPELSGLGTTLTALLRSENTIAMAHVGDSRAYLLRDGTLDQLTTDHSFVQHLVDTGRISPEDAENHPKRSMLLRALGDIEADVAVDMSAREAKAGDRWLLCTDGLTSLVSRPTLSRVLSTIADPGACADELVALALSGGAPDNVTVIVADIVDIEGKKTKKGSAAATPEIVGAVSTLDASPSAPTPARERTAAKPAAKAAELARPEKPEAAKTRDEDDERTTKPALRWWQRSRPWVLPASVAVAVFAVTFGGYVWSQRQYYIGEHDGNVAIYRGIPQSLGPIHLSSLVTEDTGLSIADLPPYERDRIAGTIRAGSMSEAWDVVDALGGSD